MQFNYLYPLVLALILFPLRGEGQTRPLSTPWQMQRSGTTESFRGLHVLSKTDVWASGTGGTVIRTTDGGRSWMLCRVPGAAELDFRDIHAFDQDTAVVISAGAPARIYRTSDGGRTWEKTYEHPSQRAFFDALSFGNAQNGIAMSDPIDDRVLLVESRDAGRSWKQLPPAQRPKVIPGEGGFAASGTNMRVVPVGGGYRTLIALGSAQEGEKFPESRIVWTDDWPLAGGQQAAAALNWQVATVPMKRSPAGGIFSMCFINSRNGVVVGGDYLKPDDTGGCGAYSSDGGKTWELSRTGPTGYRSGVAVVSTKSAQPQLLAVGTNGTDLSVDGGRNWRRISDEGFHAVQFTADGHGWASGGDGRIAKWSLGDD